MSPWWTGLAPAQATVTCAGAEHRLRWEAGELSAPDHDDAEAERALAALGGERCACVELLDAWAARRDDPRLLVLASRGPADPFAPPGDETPRFGRGRAAVSGGFSLHTFSAVRPVAAARARRSPRAMGVAHRAGASVAYGVGGAGVPIGRAGAGAGPKAGGGAEAEDELIALLGLRGGLSERLVATAAAAWRERLESRDRGATRVRAQLQAALYGRACAAIRSWLGEIDREVRLTMIKEGEDPWLSAEDGAVDARLPYGWLVDVWAKGLATTWGRFCVAAGSDDGQSWELITVGPDLGAPAAIKLELDAGR